MYLHDLSSGKEMVQIIEVKDKNIAYVESFFQLPRFSRLWIVQEWVFNSDADMMYRKASISLIKLCARLSLFRNMLFTYTEWARVSTT